MEELNGYTPPASLNLSDFQDAIGDAVVQAIIKIGIRVNREELLKALKYDRGQYKAGYDAGFADGFYILCVCCYSSIQGFTKKRKENF